MSRRDPRYASEEDAAEYRKRMGGYLAGRNAAWLDRHQCRHTGEFPPGVRELATLREADQHLVDWAIDLGLIDGSAVREGGIKFNQIGRMTALVYFRDKQHRRALAWELAAWLDRIEIEMLAAIQAAEVATGPIGDFLRRVEAVRVEEGHIGISVRTG